MLNRWLQENDFRYLIEHFGINQLDSHATLSYEQIADQLNDRMVESRQFHELKKERIAHQKTLDRLLKKKHKDLDADRKKNTEDFEKKLRNLETKLQTLTNHTDYKELKKIDNSIQKIKQTQEDKQKKMNKIAEDYDHRIADAQQKIDELNALSETILREESRVKTLIEEGYLILDTRRKALLDMLRIIARNIFYQSIQDFKACYNNLRDDHVIFRTLVESSGTIQHQNGYTIIELSTKPEYPESIQTKIDAYLQITEQKLTRKFANHNFHPILKTRNITA